jgi:hypothetical protein
MRLNTAKVILMYCPRLELRTCCGVSAVRRGADENVFFPVVTLSQAVFYSSSLPLCGARLSLAWLLGVRIGSLSLGLLPSNAELQAALQSVPGISKALSRGGFKV